MLDPGADQLLKEEIANASIMGVAGNLFNNCWKHVPCMAAWFITNKYKFLALNGSSYKYIFNRFYVSERSNYIMVQKENQFWKKWADRCKLDKICLWYLKI